MRGFPGTGAGNPVIMSTTYTGDGNSSSSRAMNMPADIAEGDLLLCYVTNISADGIQSFVTPGWNTLFSEYTLGNTGHAGAWKIANGKDTCTVTRPTSHNDTGVIWRIRGASSAYAGNQVVSGGAPYAVPPCIPAIAGGPSDFFFFQAAGGTNSAGTYTPPVGFISQGVFYPGFSSPGICSSYLPGAYVKGLSGLTFNRNASQSCSALFAVRA